MACRYKPSAASSVSLSSARERASTPSAQGVPLALVMLAPVVVNIVLFHVFLAPSGSALSVVLAAILGYLAWTYRASYRPLFVLSAERR